MKTTKNKKVHVEYFVDLSDFKKKFKDIKRMIRELKKELKSIRVG